MALSHDETIELTDVYKLMTAEELRGQLGEDADHDALINNILGEGKAVELEGGPAPKAEADDGLPGDLPAEDDDDDDTTADEDDGDDDAIEDAPAVPDAPAPQPAAPAPAPAAAVDIPDLDQSYLAEKFDAKLTELDTVNAQNLAKLMSGEMEAEDYAKAQAQYLRDRDALKDQKQIEAEWGKTVHTFQADAAKESGINYFSDTEKAESLDGWVKHLANNPKNANKDGAWFLQEAHKKVMVEYGITAQAAQKPAESVADAKKVAPKTARTPKLDNIPPTLSGLPAAAPAASGDGGEFDHIYKLDGIKYEQALARLNPEQQARFLAEQ